MKNRIQIIENGFCIRYLVLYYTTAQMNKKKKKIWNCYEDISKFLE